MIFIRFERVFAMLKKRDLGYFDVALGQKVNLSRRSGYSAKSGLATWYFERGRGFEAKVSKEGGTSRERKIKQQDAARQSRENIMRIAQNVSFSMVWNVIILIPAELLK